MEKEKTITIQVRQVNREYAKQDASAFETKSIPLTEGMSLYHALKNAALEKEGITFSAPCAGNGTCGACKVLLLKGELAITEKDRLLLSAEELEEGWRLACQAYPTEACEILVPSERFVAVTGYENMESEVAELSQPVERSLTEGAESSREKNLAIAIDLGTTTLAYELFSLTTGKTVAAFSSVNPQRIYGADVVSRMDQSNNGRREMLKNTIRQGIRKDIVELLGDVQPQSVQKIGISGNTTMVHLLMGYSCEGLGKYPFTAETLDRIDTDAYQMGMMDVPIPVTISPGFSAYVGGDVLMGAAAQNITESHKPCLFLDLGTNAEMLLTDGNGKIYVTSAPAGPAFEAANISCGVGSVEGAISSVTICNGGASSEYPAIPKITWETIGGKEPVGFCGSGILEAVYELLKNNLIDETGLLTDEYFDAGYPVGKLKITQSDIRQIQLAKSAVFSAIEILLQAAGLTADAIGQVWLAGGFGYRLNIEKAIGMGLLPETFMGKIKAVGNTSLKGAKEYLTEMVLAETIRKLKNSCEEIYLSNEADFQKFFMENMNFQTL